jgi:DNA-binding Lrp family transcriptional regulator
MTNNNNFIVLNFAEARMPEYREKKGQGYIEFGELNDYPDYLLRLFNKSAKHNAIVRGKVNYIMGNGWKSDNEDDAAAKAFIDAPNRYESLTDLTKKVSIDIEVFGGAYLSCVWSAAGGNLASISHVDYTRIRTSADNTSYWYKKDWSDRKEKPKIIPAFTTSMPTGEQILYIKEYRPSLDAYALPSYMGALNYIESDIKVSEHVLGNAETGFSASKLITLPNGEPSDEEKRNIDRRFRDNFGGADGKKFMLSFVNDPTRKPIVEDLGASDLTKEDFGRVDSMIQQNIFAGHQITSPSLFGIAEAGKLGTRNEIRDAYEIFKNTYVNDKQQALESVFNRLASLRGVTSQLSIIPVEPISYELSEAAIMTVAPREWVLEKAGIDITKYEPQPEDGQPVQAEQVAVNDNLKSMSGRQWQQMARIIREFTKGKITREQASLMLRSGYGMSEEEITTMLGAEEFREELSEDETLDVFAEYGASRHEFEVVSSKPLQFAEVKDAADKKILEILQKYPLTPSADIAKAIRVDVAEVEARISRLVDDNILKIYKDGRIKPVKPVSEIVEKPTTVEFEVRYSYEWKPEVPTGQRDTPEHPSRKFCKRLMELERFYLRSEIEQMSRRLGYSVFDRGGGWWGDSPSCRHEWRSNIVQRKKK